MSINLGNALALLLLLSIVGVGGIPSAASQNTSLNINASDIIDLVGNVTKSMIERGNDYTNFPLVNDSSTSSSSVTTSEPIKINEVELNSPSNDEKQWIELYNPTKVDINISNFEIRTPSKSVTIELPYNAIIEAGKEYVIEVNQQQMLPHTVESLILTDATGNILDRTPTLVDRSHDERTWQRIPDGSNEWQFVEGTPSNLNDPNSRSTTYNSGYSGSNVKCLGSAGCAEGIAIRIVDADTLYVKVNSTVYKVNLALIKPPSTTEERRFIESTAFTRNLCLGSTALVDQDDKLPTSNSSIIAVVYCSSTNLNSKLLDNGYADLDVGQCTTSEFAHEPWAKAHGC